MKPWLGLVESYAHPGSNVTGITPYLPDLPAKQMQIVRDVIPGAKKVGLLGNLSDVKAVPQHEELVEAARKFNKGKPTGKSKLDRKGKHIIYPPDLKDKLINYDLSIPCTHIADLFTRLSNGGWETFTLCQKTVGNSHVMPEGNFT